jgi:hypothetical protein
VSKLEFCANDFEGLDEKRERSAQLANAKLLKFIAQSGQIIKEIKTL